MRLATEYTEAAAPGAVPFRIIERLGGRVIGQSGFAQVVIGISNIHEMGPLRSEKIEADRVDRNGIQRHKDAARPGIVERRHLPFQLWWTIRVVASIEPIDDKENGFLAKILMTQVIYERSVTC